LGLAISGFSQDYYVSPAYYPVEAEIVPVRVDYVPSSDIPDPRLTWWQRNQKGFAITGVMLTSVVLDAVGDAVYDMGKETGNSHQRRVGHTLQAVAIGTPFLALPMIDWRFPISDGIFLGASYVAMRYAIFDLAYNTTRGIDPLYATGWKAQMPPGGRAFTQFISLSLSIGINFTEY